jgi:hypothetical protein
MCGDHGMSLVLLLFSVVPRECVVRESVDLIEVNHFYDEQARLVFDQAVFYTWNRGRYDVVSWRLIKSPDQVPIRDWSGGGYTALWQDGEVLRKVYSPAIRETWLQHDPELVEREYLPKEARRELKQAKGR